MHSGPMDLKRPRGQLSWIEGHKGRGSDKHASSRQGLINSGLAPQRKAPGSQGSELKTIAGMVESTVSYTMSMTESAGSMKNNHQMSSVFAFGSIFTDSQPDCFSSSFSFTLSLS